MIIFCSKRRVKSTRVRHFSCGSQNLDYYRIVYDSFPVNGNMLQIDIVMLLIIILYFDILLSLRIKREREKTKHKSIIIIIIIIIMIK